MADINAIAEQIQGLTLLEASQLVKLLEEKLGVSAAAAAAAVAPSGGGAAAPAAAPAEGKTQVTLGLAAGRAQQIQRHQSLPPGTQPRPEGSQGFGRRRAEDH